MGLLRLYLALCVVQWHYMPPTTEYFLFSFSAVLCFFIISGFYMALILRTKYASAGAFYLGRFLRIYPTYWTALAILLLMAAAGLVPHLSNWLHDLPNQLLIFPRILWRNITLQDTAAGGLGLGQMAAVALELVFYAIAPFLVSRSLLVLIGMTLAALAFHLWLGWAGLDIRQYQYEWFPGVAAFFLTGILSYRLYEALRLNIGALGFLPLAAIFAFPLFYPTVQAWVNTPTIYAFYACFALSLPFLFAAAKSNRADRFIGDLSYPLYVAHIIPMYTPQIGTAWTIVAVIGLTLALRFTVDYGIEKVRTIIASRQQAVAVSARTYPQAL